MTFTKKARDFGKTVQNNKYLLLELKCQKFARVDQTKTSFFGDLNEIRRLRGLKQFNNKLIILTFIIVEAQRELIDKGIDLVST